MLFAFAQDAEKAARFKAQQEAQAKQWADTLAGIERRARARPLLVELEAQERAKLQSRRKTLLLIKASLQESGVDWKRFFDAHELADLEEAELFAKKEGPLSP